VRLRHAERLAHHLQRDPLGAARNFRGFRRLVPPSKVLVKVGIERRGQTASGTGRGPPFHRVRRQHAERLAPNVGQRQACFFLTSLVQGLDN
jgi:hypothetical protein